MAIKKKRKENIKQGKKMESKLGEGSDTLEKMVRKLINCLSHRNRSIDIWCKCINQFLGITNNLN